MITVARYRDYSIVKDPKGLLVREGVCGLDTFPASERGAAEACLYIADVAVGVPRTKGKHKTFSSRLFTLESQIVAERREVLRILAVQVESTSVKLK